METLTDAKVKVGKLPGVIKEVTLSEGDTVKDILDKVDMSPEGYEVRLNSRPAGMGEVVGPGDQVLLVKKIQGND